MFGMDIYDEDVYLTLRYVCIACREFYCRL